MRPGYGGARASIALDVASYTGSMAKTLFKPIKERFGAELMI